jgi:putative Mg2+ transporter-C (MgtC) family protein
MAAILGGLVGWERESKEGAAGLRTHMVVCVASSLVMIVSSFGFADIIGKTGIELDPSRIAAQVISGIGFLGAGTILFLGPRVVKGLTTAAGLWSVAAVGLAVGGGLYVAAIMTTVILLVVLALVKLLERHIFKKNKAITIHFQTGKTDLSEIERLLKKHRLKSTEITLRPGNGDTPDELKITVTTNPDDNLVLMEELRKFDGVIEIGTAK